MSKTKKWLSIVLIGVMLFTLCLTGCQSDTQPETPAEAPTDASTEEAGENQESTGNGNGATGHSVGYVQLTLGTTYHAAMSERFEELCAERGVNVSMTASQNRAAEEQLKLAEDLIAQGVEALVLNPVGDEIVPSVVKLCDEAGIPLICVDNTSAGSGYTYIGIDNFAIARGIGQ